MKLILFFAFEFKYEKDERDLSPLESIKDHYPKYLLTLDSDPISSHNGIKKMNVVDWLLQ